MNYSETMEQPKGDGFSIVVERHVDLVIIPADVVTLEMLLAASEAGDENNAETIKRVFKAMVAAAPTVVRLDHVISSGHNQPAIRGVIRE